MPVPKKWGTWGNGSVANEGLFNSLKPYLQGFNYRLSWSDIEVSAGVYNFTYFDTQLNYAFDNDLYAGFMIFVGDNAPSFVINSVPHFTNDRGTWPYYMDSGYITKLHNMVNALVAHIATYDSGKLDKLLFWMSAEGSTGDEGPYKGTVPTQYAIDESPEGEWDIFKRNFWTFLYNAIVSNGLDDRMRILVNQGNNGRNFQWALDHLPEVWMKAGNMTHTYDMVGFGDYAGRIETLRDYSTDLHRVRGEFENTDDLAWWTPSTNQNFFAMVCQDIHGNIDMLNISSATAQDNNWISNPYAFQFFTKYTGIRTPEDNVDKVGFVAFRDKIDIGDTTRFPVSPYYGPVVNQNTTQYNNKVNQINNRTDLSDEEKADSISTLTVQAATPTTYKYLNPDRIAKIRAAIPTSSYLFIVKDNVADSYDNEYSYQAIPGNYQRFITQIDPNGTSEGVWRVGPTSSFFGRYARQFKIVNGQGELFFLLDPDFLDVALDDTNDVIFKVTYYDSGTGIWSLNVNTCKGKSEIKVIQNKNTNTWKTIEVPFNGFSFSPTLANSSNLTIKYLSGANTIFSILEFQNVT